MYIKLIRKPEVLCKTGWSKSTLYNRIRSELFPPPVSIGDRAVAFIEFEVGETLKALIKGYSPEQMKALVADLVAQRQVMD
ncbi:AlpA family phage regulatory protein [Psychrosphaera sp.]|nr:AlpA family phage regulatory protein [Psychrosphaera sp.]